MVVHDRVEENWKPGTAHRNFILIAIAVPLIFAHWALAGFDPIPYGTAAIDGSEVELFAPAGGSPVLIFAVSGVLLFGRVRRIAAGLGSTPHWSLGLGFLTSGAALQRWADYVGAPELLVLSFILLLLGSVSLVAGRDGLRATWAPALFLIFAFPIPAIVVNSVIWPLQLQTASNVSSFLGLIGYSPQKYADVILLNGHWFQVIETCSGMRMIETVMMAASLYSILFFRRRSQVVILMLAAPVIGYFVNFVRVISVMFNPYAEWTTVHTAQGVVMLVVGVLMLAGLDSLLERHQGSHRRASSEKSNSPVDASRFRISGIATALSALLLLIACNFAIKPWLPGKTPAPRAFSLPGILAGSKPTPLKLDRQFLGSIGVSNWLNRRYQLEGAPVEIQVLADDRLNRHGSVISPRAKIPGRSFVELSHEEIALYPGVYVDRILYQSPHKRTLVYHWTEGTRSVFEEAVRNMFALDRGPIRRNSFALSLRLSTDVGRDIAGIEKADRRLNAFASIVRDSLK